jgi:hypothetical protein
MSTIGQAIPSADNVKLIIDVLADYTKETGIDLSKNPFSAKLEQSRSPDAILQLLEEREKAFKEYRNGKGRLINCLNPAVRVLHKFSGILSEAVGRGLVSRARYLVDLLTLPRQIPFPPASALFVGIDTLLSVRPSDVPSKVPLIYGHARLPVRLRQVMMLSRISLSIWGVSSSAWTSIPPCHLLR